MAIDTLLITCENCGKNVLVIHSAGSDTPSICDKCSENIEILNKSLFLATRKKLSIGQRLEKIESDIYDLQRHQAQPAWDGLIGKLL